MDKKQSDELEKLNADINLLFEFTTERMVMDRDPKAEAVLRQYFEMRKETK